jgi:hypothetical protein
MADRGAEAIIESIDDMVCGVGVEVAKEDAFAAPNSASVLYILKMRISKAIYIYIYGNVTWKTSILMAFIDTISVIKAYAMAG